MNVSAVVICRDEEKNIEDCLKSLQWCSEIIVADSYSKDNTLPIAGRYTDKIYQNEWKGFSEQRKFALSKASGEWILSVDADERCSPELTAEITRLLNKNNDDRNGYLIPRKSFFLGKLVKHCGWYPDYQLRLFRKNSVTVTDRLVHEGYELNGIPGKLENPLLHYTVNSVSDFAEKINHYSSLSASEKYMNKKISFSYLLFKPFFEFKKKFVFQGGYRDGITGLMVSLFHMITKALTYMKMYELQNKKDK
ncbi:MAG: glycosyltransferase family 2 protein [Ignavibacteria bacterium]|nr:glycosyltransferase family 2 protein [Ignavibacteria bacterium]